MCSSLKMKTLNGLLLFLTEKKSPMRKKGELRFRLNADTHPRSLLEVTANTHRNHTGCSRQSCMVGEKERGKARRGKRGNGKV